MMTCCYCYHPGLRRIFRIPLITTFFLSVSIPSGSGSFDQQNYFQQRQQFYTRNMSSSFPKIEKNVESKATMIRLLDQGHCEYDITYKDHFASHLPHAICSLYDLGASKERLESYYKWYVERLVPLRKPNFSINADNWTNYIGNTSVYSELLDFFDKEVSTHGLQSSLDVYFPRLIPGLVGAALHPLIHIGYGMEYGLPKALAEGLAYATTFYHKSGELINKLQPPPAPTSQDPSSSALELIHELKSLGIPEKYRQASFDTDVQNIVTKYEAQLLSLLSKWNFSPTSSSSLIDSKMNDLTLASVQIFFGSYRSNSLGFFLAHGLTGNHAVRILLPFVQGPELKIKLLQSYLLALLGVYVIEGRPEFSSDTIYKYKKVGSEDSDPRIINWDEILAQTVACEDEHVIKVIRSLLVLKSCLPNDVIPHDLIDSAGYMMVNTIKKEDEWIFDGIGNH